jgi:hypothetical protein
MSTKPLLFIDSNQYLQLYGLLEGKALLDFIEEQRGHIVITTQIVDEVMRNKFGKAMAFILDKFKDIASTDFLVPDHLFGLGDAKIKESRKTQSDAANVKKELKLRATDYLTRIGRSEDDVSKRLESLFNNASAPSEEELQRARDRKERGNPPGKRSDPLGDQVSWEQLLSCCKRLERLWIITADKDYHVEYEKNCNTESIALQGRHHCLW